MIDEILARRNLKYEDLNTLERETLNKWMESLQKGILTVEKVREYIQQMRESVQREISETPSNAFTWFLGWKRDYLLKARLRNYTLIESMLISPERAKAAIERQLAGIVPNK